MLVTVALHRDSSGSDKKFLICIARRAPLNELKDKPALLGFDQFSSRINLQYQIESLDARYVQRVVHGRVHSLLSLSLVI